MAHTLAKPNPPGRNEFAAQAGKTFDYSAPSARSARELSKSREIVVTARVRPPRRLRATLALAVHGLIGPLPAGTGNGFPRLF
jgi:hypothetical protein